MRDTRYWKKRELALAEQLGCERIPLSGGDVLKRQVEDINCIHWLGQVKSTGTAGILLRKQALIELREHARQSGKTAVLVFELVRPATASLPDETQTWVCFPLEMLDQLHLQEHLVECMKRE